MGLWGLRVGPASRGACTRGTAACWRPPRGRWAACAQLREARAKAASLAQVATRRCSRRLSSAETSADNEGGSGSLPGLVLKAPAQETATGPVSRLCSGPSAAPHNPHNPARAPGAPTGAADGEWQPKDARPPSGSRVVTVECQVAGCGAAVTGEPTKFAVVHRLCPAHLRRCASCAAGCFCGNASCLRISTLSAPPPPPLEQRPGSRPRRHGCLCAVSLLPQLLHVPPGDGIQGESWTRPRISRMWTKSALNLVLARSHRAPAAPARRPPPPWLCGERRSQRDAAAQAAAGSWPRLRPRPWLPAAAPGLFPLPPSSAAGIRADCRGCSRLCCPTLAQTAGRVAMTGATWRPASSSLRLPSQVSSPYAACSPARAAQRVPELLTGSGGHRGGQCAA